MTKTVELAKTHNVKITAHPSYPDKENFGRISQHYDSDTLLLLLQEQVEQLMAICQQFDVVIEFIKPHGALYHDMLKQASIMEVMCKLIEACNPAMSLLVQAGSKKEHVARLSDQYAINLIDEAFADRRYQGEQLLPRTQKGALIEDVDEIIRQYQHFSTKPAFNVDTVCFHSDHPPSVVALQKLKGS